MTQEVNTGVFSVVGRPNVGKSTLLNALCGAKIAIVSDKPQTTRTRITGILDEDGYQMVFLDTPGLHRPRNPLGEYMVRRVYETVEDVDTVLLVVEPVARIGIPEQLLIDRIREYGLPAILVINKIDTVQKEELLEVIATYSAACDWLAVVPLSAKTGDGVELLLRELRAHTQPSPRLFPEGQMTDQPERVLIAELVREKLLQNLQREVPHGLAVAVERMEEQGDVVHINVVIFCEKKSHKGIIIGKNGALLKKVGAAARREIEELLSARVYLELFVKVKEDWRLRPQQIRQMGFEE